MLKEDKVYNVIINRIIYRIDNKDIKINYSRKFKIITLSIYERG